MSGNYARVVGGKITPIRYTKEHLLFAGTLEAVLAQGDMVVPLYESADNLTPDLAPTYRDLLPVELEHAVLSASDITKNVYRYDIGNKVAPLDTSGDILEEYLPGTVVYYRGAWNPETNIPKLEDGIGDESDVYQVVEGFEDDLKVDFGSGLVTVRSGLRVVYRDGRWRATGHMYLSNLERAQLDNVMYAQPNLDYDGQGGSEAGAFSIKTYPGVLEMLSGGTMIAQLIPQNAVKEELLLLDDGGLTGLEFSPITGELTVNGGVLPLGRYTPTFHVSSSLSHGAPVEVAIEIMEYTIEGTTEDITAPTASTVMETIVSPQDTSPSLVVVDDGGLWDVSIEDDSIVVIDTTYAVAGTYNPQVQSNKSIGVSEVLTLDIDVTIPDGVEEPIWDKVEVEMGGLTVIPDDSKVAVRLDLVGLDTMPVDSVV